MTNEKRRAIAEEQSDLLNALVGEIPVPKGFAADRVDACAISLQRKRLRTILRLHRWLADELGDDAWSQFSEYCRTQPSIPAPGAQADAALFVAFLKRTKRLGHNPIQSALKKLSQTICSSRKAE